MSSELSIHGALADATQWFEEFFENHSTWYKVALLVNHLFRAASMTSFSLLLPFSNPVSIGICFASSLFYRLTVETHCAYKFALPAFAGSLVLTLGGGPLIDLITGVAFSSLRNFVAGFGAAVALGVYLTYIIATVSHDVDGLA